MLDYQKVVSPLANPISEVLKGYERFEAYGTTFKQNASGAYVGDQTYYGMRLTLRYPDIIQVENSLHKFAQGGFNVFDFYHEDMINALYSLYSGLNVADIEQVKIYRPEFECSIQFPDPEEFYRSFISLRDKRFTEMTYKGSCYGKSFETDYYKLKVYSKYLQMKGERGTIAQFENMYPDSIEYLKQNVRIEFVPLKSRYFGSSHPLTMKDLKDKEFLSHTYDGFIKKLCNTEREKRLIDGSVYSNSELHAFATLTHPNPAIRNMMKKESLNQYKYFKTLNNNLPTKILSDEDLYKCLTEKKNILLY